MSHHKMLSSAFIKALYTVTSVYLQNSPLHLSKCPELKVRIQIDILNIPVHSNITPKNQKVETIKVL